MSAFYALVHDDHIEMLTDGAVYEDDGTLTAIRRKVWYSDAIPMAITGRGNAKAVELLAMACLLPDVYGNVDKVVENIPTLLDKMASRAVEPRAETAVEILVAAISETRGPLLMYATTANCYGLDWLEPFKLYDVGQEWGGGVAVDASGIDVTGGLHGCGAELFERMRRVSAPNPHKPELPPIHGIGGHVDLTTVRQRGVTVERIHEWPDVIGEKIKPDVDMAVAA